MNGDLLEISTREYWTRDWPILSAALRAAAAAVNSRRFHAANTHHRVFLYSAVPALMAYLCFAFEVEQPLVDGTSRCAEESVKL